MSNEESSFALGIALDEIQKNCSGVKNAFIFSEDGETITGDGNTPEKTVVRAVDTFDSIIEKGEAIGGVEAISLGYSKGRVYFPVFDSGSVKAKTCPFRSSNR